MTFRTPGRLRSPRRRAVVAGIAIGVVAVVTAACSGGGSDSASTLTLYSGRAEVQIQPIIDQFTKDTGVKVKVRYGATPELAAQIAEEGPNSPADIFFAQDAGALGSVDKVGLFAPIPAETLAEVESKYRAEDGDWIGITGRAG